MLIYHAVMSDHLGIWIARTSLLSILFLLLGDSVSPEPAMHPTIKSTSCSSVEGSIEQGIQGRVTRLSGNHMPSNLPSLTGVEGSVMTTVWVFRGRVADPGSPAWPVSEAVQHPELVDRVQSSSDGQYAVSVAPRRVYGACAV